MIRKMANDDRRSAGTRRPTALHVGRVRDLLAQAVEYLDGSDQSTSSSRYGQSGVTLARGSRISAPTLPPAPLARPRGGLSWQAQAFSERNSLFNYGGGSKRKGNSGKGQGKKESKKKRMSMWSHEFVCLASKDQEKTPSAMQRSQLITGGMIIPYCRLLGFIVYVICRWGLGIYVAMLSQTVEFVAIPCG